MKRPSLPSAIEVEVLTKSARRCALCFGLENDFSEKKGQIAHLDKNHSNHSIHNLVFLCLDHHDSYDGRSSQSKGYQNPEISHYRNLLYDTVSKRIPREQRFEKEISISEKQFEVVGSIALRYFSLEKSKDLLEKQIMARAQAIRNFFKYINGWERKETSNSCDDDGDDEYDRQYEYHVNFIRENLSIPQGVYGLICDGEISDSWIENVEYLVSVWTAGEATYDECTDLIWELDDRYDFDMHWILFGIPNSDLPRLAYHYLQNFVYVFGLRGQSKHRDKQVDSSD